MHVAEHTKALTVSCRTLSNIRGRSLPHQNKETETEFDQLIHVETILYDALAFFIAELHARLRSPIAK